MPNGNYRLLRSPLVTLFAILVVLKRTWLLEQHDPNRIQYNTIQVGGMEPLPTLANRPTPEPTGEQKYTFPTPPLSKHTWLGEATSMVNCRHSAFHPTHSTERHKHTNLTPNSKALSSLTVPVQATVLSDEDLHASWTSLFLEWHDELNGIVARNDFAFVGHCEILASPSHVLPEKMGLNSVVARCPCVCII